MDKETTKVTEVKLKSGAGRKALEAIDSAVFRALGHTSSFASMKGMQAWLPYRLEKFVNCGGWYVVNNQGFQVGETRDVRITHDHHAQALGPPWRPDITG